MDKKAFYKLEYGVFLISTRAGDKVNGCITNTCIQAASNPTRVAIASINTNYTTELIKESGIFTVSILNKTTDFDTIEHFGMQSGRNVDKFAGMECPEDENQIPYLDRYANAVLSCKVVSSQDLGSHTLFIAEVTDAKVLSEDPSLTYAFYQSEIKPKPASPKQERKVKAWRCKICGYIYEGSELPADFTCPLCGHPADDFEPIYEKNFYSILN